MRTRIRTQRCEVVRTQQPPYGWKTTDYHEWVKAGGYCKHCGLFREQVKVADKDFAPSHADAREDSRG